MFKNKNNCYICILLQTFVNKKPSYFFKEGFFTKFIFQRKPDKKPLFYVEISLKSNLIILLS